MNYFKEWKLSLMISNQLHNYYVKYLEISFICLCVITMCRIDRSRSHRCRRGSLILNCWYGTWLLIYHLCSSLDITLLDLLSIFAARSWHSFCLGIGCSVFWLLATGFPGFRHRRLTTLVYAIHGWSGFRIYKSRSFQWDHVFDVSDDS